MRVSFASNDERTAKRVSDALGTATEIRDAKNYAGHRLSPWLGHLMVSRQETARPLLTPGEVTQLPHDRLSRQMERLERHGNISNEALALFVRFWLTITPPLPDSVQAAAQAKGRERYDGFVEALARRLARGRTLADEISRDVGGGEAKGMTKPNRTDRLRRRSPVFCAATIRMNVRDNLGEC